MAKTVYIKTGLTGGGGDDLDAVDGDDLLNLDIGIVIDTNVLRMYEVNTSASLSEDSPRVIVPDTNPGNIGWILKSGLNGYYKVMSGNETFVSYSDHWHCFLDAGGAIRNFNPSGTFADGYKMVINNFGDEGITFDSSGIASMVLPGDMGLFFYDANSATWR